MDIQRTLEILEALAAGCSPITGAVLQKESILQERDVIRALQMAIDLLKKERLIPKSDVDIAQEDIEAAIQLFHEQGKSPTANNLTGFLGGMRQFKNEALVSHERYGKYKHTYSHGILLDFFTAYLQQHPVPVNNIRANYHWREMEFFKQSIFNRLTPGAFSN